MTEFVVPSASFWNFSLSLYDKPGCAQHCLALQDDHGFDVNLVLFCVWFAKNWGTMPEEVQIHAISFSLEWKQQVVQPIRNLRTAMKQNTPLSSSLPNGEYESFRDEVKNLELAAEKKQQEFLEDLSTDQQSEGPIDVDAPLRNLKALSQQLGIEIDDKIAEHFAALIRISEEMEI